MMNNPAMINPSNPAGNLPSGQPPVAPTHGVPAGMPPVMSAQARQNQNDEILSRCLGYTQRLRENLQVLLNSTKQAANIDSDESGASSSTSSSTTNLSFNPANLSIRNNINQKLTEMSQAFDQLGQSLEQYDFKLVQNQQPLVNHYNELSYEKQGMLVDEWSSSARWVDKLLELFPSLHPSTQMYRRNHRTFNIASRARIDGPSFVILERLINQFESTTQQQQSVGKDYSLTLQRLSDHLNILHFCLFRAGLDISLYLRHCTVEHVVVKPLNEKKQFASNGNSKSFSNYRALEIIAGHIRAAAVNHAPFGTQGDSSLQKLLSYIYKYQTLHASKCVACQKHLLNGLQPTWRDFKSYECYHEECWN